MDGSGWSTTPPTSSQVDPTTGVATAVGTLPNPINGLVGSCSGQLLAITESATNGSLISFNPASPSTPTTIGNLGIVTQDVNTGVTGLDFAPDGTLWALRNQVTTSEASFQINTSTGAATQVRADVMPPNVATGLAIAPLSCPSSPAPAAPTVVVTAPHFTGCGLIVLPKDRLPRRQS